MRNDCKAAGFSYILLDLRLENSATAVLAFLSQNLIHIIFGGCYFSRLEGLAASTGVWTLGRMISSGSLPNNQELVFTPCVSQIRSIGTQLSRHHLLCGQHNVSDHPSGSGGCMWFCRVATCDCDGLILTQKVYIAQPLHLIPKVCEFILWIDWQCGSFTKSIQGWCHLRGSGGSSTWTENESVWVMI